MTGEDGELIFGLLGKCPTRTLAEMTEWLMIGNEKTQRWCRTVLAKLQTRYGGK